ncbi:MAG TPA: restriction endonuclease [Herpetosiphonaceae bacterium]
MAARGPQFVRYFAPVIEALKELGGSGRPSEVRDVIAQHLKISEQERASVNKSGASRFENRVHWARFYLAKAGYLDSSTRGVWSLTEKGQSVTKMTHEDALAIFSELHSQFAADRNNSANDTPSTTMAEADENIAPSPTLTSADSSYRTRLLELLQALPPAGFERLCQRLLREAGFEQVVVTGRSGDGGLDGQGVLQLNPFVSFKVLFQCKRYTGAVTASQVRDFRGAMMGRADKGIILTTGTFTADAQKEALRDGVPPIELVNGEKLLDMFENLELGLKPRKTFDIDQAFFEPFQA